MRDVIWMVVIGFVVGLLAKFLTPGRDPGGFLVTIVIGIVGALAATYGGQALGIYAPGEPAGFVGALVGAIVLLLLLRLVRRR